MSDSTGVQYTALDRTAGLAGALTYLLVGVLPVVMDVSMAPPWWALWVLGLPLFVAGVLLDLPPRLGRALLVPMLVLGAAMYAVEPLYGFGGVPMVITAAAAGMILSLPAGLALVAVQVGVMLIAGYRLGAEEGLLASFFYAGLQIFAVMTGQIARRESLARTQIAEVHEDLRTAHADLARAHEELGAAQARLAETSRTDERLRISRDLHDLVGHQLSALALNLEVAAHLVEGPAADQVERSRALAKDLLADVRHVVGRLREESPDVRTSLEQFAALIPRPKVHLDVPASLAIPSETARDALVRSVQEAITNSVRHSGAANAWVRIRHTDGAVEAEVRDDGRGAETVRPGNGLTGMRERLEALGGTLGVDGSHGFRVRLTVPLAGTAKQEPERQVAR